jgi:hypothetical protein
MKRTQEQTPEHASHTMDLDRSHEVRQAIITSAELAKKISLKYMNHELEELDHIFSKQENNEHNCTLKAFTSMFLRMPLLVQQAAKESQGEKRAKNEVRSRANGSIVNDCIRNCMQVSENSDLSIDEFIAVLLDYSAEAKPRPLIDNSPQAHETVGGHLWRVTNGAWHEYNFSKLIAATEMPYKLASVSEDLNGWDAAIEVWDGEFAKLDVKNNWETLKTQVDRRGHDADEEYVYFPMDETHTPSPDSPSIIVVPCGDKAYVTVEYGEYPYYLSGYHFDSDSDAITNAYEFTAFLATSPALQRVKK